MSALINNNIWVITLLVICAAVSLYMMKFPKVSKMGPAVIVIILGIVLSAVGLLPHTHAVYNTIMGNIIFLAIPLYLLDVNLKEIFSLSKQPVIAMVSAVASVCVVSVIAGIFFAPHIPEGWKLGGMFVGTYTGGSSTLSAIGVSLDASANTFALANAADYLICVPLSMFMFAVPGIFASSKRFQKWWPYTCEKKTLESETDIDFMKSKEWSITEIAELLAIAAGIFLGSVILSTIFPSTYQGIIVLLIETTAAIALAQLKPVRKLKGSKDLGLYMSLIFLTVVGCQINFAKLFTGSGYVLLYCFVIIVGAMIMHAIICRLLKINFEYMNLSLQASIGDSSTAAMLAGTAGWTNLVGMAIVMGIIGMVAGNYLGGPIALLIKSLIGA